jgi:hypothetical protein
MNVKTGGIHSYHWPIKTAFNSGKYNNMLQNYELMKHGSWNTRCQILNLRQVKGTVMSVCQDTAHVLTEAFPTLMSWRKLSVNYQFQRNKLCNSAVSVSVQRIIKLIFIHKPIHEHVYMNNSCKINVKMNQNPTIFLRPGLHYYSEVGDTAGI